jgi:tyrosyl-tRNA synthetase
MSIDTTTGGLIFPEDKQKVQRHTEPTEEAAEPSPDQPTGEAKPIEDEADALNPDFNPEMPSISIEERYNLCMSVGEEVIGEERLRPLLERMEEQQKNFICYDGFEPSGRMHIAQGLMKTAIVNKLTKAGGVFIFWVADWFAALNLKFDGDLAKIRIVGKYFVEIWKACGMNLKNVKFLWCSDEINKNADKYWGMVMDIAQKNTLNRILRCTQIMGREETDKLQASQIFYPCMQATDIFYLKADIC